MAQRLGRHIFPKLAAAPGTPTQGQVYYNTTDTLFYGYNGSTWIDLSAAGGSVGIDPTQDWKQSCRAATTANITIATALNSADVIDGVTLADGDRVLVKDQTTGSENGIYVVGASPARASDADTAGDITASAIIPVSEGTTQADTTWRLTTNNPITIGTTALVFVRTDWPKPSPWIPIMVAHVNLSAAAAATYVGHLDATTNLLSTGASPAQYTVVQQYIDPADYLVVGRTTQMRVVASFAQNAVANAGTSVATAGLYGVNPAGATTTYLPTYDAVIAGSTAAKTGGTASTNSVVASSTFTAPAADMYALAVAVSVATTAGSTKIGLRLEYRNG